MLPHVIGLRSLLDDRVYGPDEVDYVAPDHGREGILDVVYDYERIRAQWSPASLAASGKSGIWRYKPLLPVAAEAAEPPLAVGGTPLYPAGRLAAAVGLTHLWVKDEGRNPTASLKDRASAVAVVKAAERQASIITTASTGNAAAALAGLCAATGQACVIFVPRAAPPAKIAQLLAYGARVFLVEGTYDEAFDLCLDAAEAFGWYNRNTAYNPYMTEGKKSVSYEIAEQLGWQAPDAVFVSVGDGCIIGGVHKGFKDLLALGWIDHVPRLFGVQAAGSNFLAEAWERNEDPLTKAPRQAETVADSISAGLPRDRLKAMAAVKETGGAFVTVSDTVILAAVPALARATGVFAEPAGAAAYAGLVQAVGEGLIQVHERVVVINTGNGLKDIQSALQAVEQAGARALTIPPDLAAVRQVLTDRGFDPSRE